MSSDDLRRGVPSRKNSLGTVSWNLLLAKYLSTELDSGDANILESFLLYSYTDAPLGESASPSQLEAERGAFLERGGGLFGLHAAQPP